LINQANADGVDGGNKKDLKCPVCGMLLIKREGECDIEYVCFNPVCRKEHEFPSYYGNTQDEINNNLIKSGT
jgi:hypothetical protein